MNIDRALNHVWFKQVNFCFNSKNKWNFFKFLISILQKKTKDKNLYEDLLNLEKRVGEKWLTNKWNMIHDEDNS